MRSGRVVRFSSEIPTPSGETVNYYFIDETGYQVLCDIFPEIADLFDYSYQNDGLYYAPASEFTASSIYSVIMNDENLSTFVGFMPFAPSNMPSAIAGL